MAQQSVSDHRLAHSLLAVQFDKVVSALIGLHAFTVLAPQILVLQKMLDAVSPKGEPSGQITAFAHPAVSQLQAVSTSCAN